jgi:hypothetical protein
LRQAIDFKGSSFVDTLAIARKAFGHPLQPGNSKTQKSSYDSSAFPSGDAFSNRQTNGGAFAGSASAM